MTDRQAIQAAYLALCKYNSPSLTNRQKLDALGDCWSILSGAALRSSQVDSSSRQNNWIDGEEKELE